MEAEKGTFPGPSMCKFPYSILIVYQGGRKQGGTRCWCPPTLHRPLQLCIVCVTLCGDSKCFTIFTLYLYNKV